MTSKKVTIDEKPKGTKGVFRRSESVIPPGLNIRKPSSSSLDINGKNSQALFRRSSMICSEGFDKYTFDCHKNVTPSRSIGHEVKKIHFENENETLTSPVNRTLTTKPPAVKQTSILKKVKSSSLLVKRDSVVHPGRVDMQRSLCIAGRFQNPWPTWRPPTFTNLLKFGISRDKSKVPPKQVSSF